MIYRILNYDLLNIPDDIIKSFASLRGQVIYLSILYLLWLSLTLYGLIMLVQFDLSFACIIYLITVVVNCAVIIENPYLLYLNRHPYRETAYILFVITGPFGLIKIVYILACLRLAVNKKWVDVIIKRPSEVWYSEADDNSYNFRHSLMKYQQRLKDKY